MLERAARCLDTRSPITWRLSKKAIQSRRQLHFAFWRHGANDLDLHAYCLESVANLFESSRSTFVDRNNPGRDPNEFPFLLDFLYPQEAQALLRRWTLKRRRHSYRRETPLRTQSGSRSFASVTRDAVADPPAVEEYQENAEEDTPVQDDTVDASDQDQERAQHLNSLLRNGRSQPVETIAGAVWELYNALSHQALREQFQKPVSRLLSRSLNPLDTARVAQLLYEIPEENRDGPTYVSSILALLRSGKEDGAAAVHDEIMSRGAVEDSVFDVSTTLLLRLFENESWEQVLTSFDLHYASQQQQRPSKENFEWRRDFLERLAAVPDYASKAGRAMDHFVLKAASAGNQVSHDFVALFLAPVFHNGISPRLQLKVLGQMRKLAVSLSTFCHAACRDILEQNSPINDRLDAALRCYLILREDGHTPSKTLLRKLLHFSVNAKNRELVDHFTAEWRDSYGQLDTSIAVVLMKWHSRRADVAACEEVMAQHKRNSHALHHGYFYPILHAEALRYGPEAVERRLQWMKTEFDLTADVRCWNILLHACARYDDLDRAQATIERMQQAEVAPDGYTVGTVLSICGNRGDVQLARSYLRLATLRDIAISPAMIESLVLAYMNDDQVDQAIALAEMATPDAPSKATRAWTQILAGLATHRRSSKAFEVSARMRDLGVPFDGPAYAALMRVFTANGQPGMALRVMSNLMRRDQVPYSAIHYALLINGYADARQFETGFRAHAQWLKDSKKFKIPDSIAVRVALLKLRGLATKQELSMQSVSRPGVRVEALEELFQEFLEDTSGLLLGDRNPQILLGDRTLAEAQPAAYFDTLFAVYGRTKAIDMTEYLLQTLEKRLAADHPKEYSGRSVRVLYDIMRARFDANDYLSVSRLWNTAVNTVTRQSDMGKRSAEPPALESREAERVITPKLPASTHGMLARHLDVYLQSLSRQRAMPEMFRTLEAFEQKGFVLDNTNWNQYVQILCKGGYFVQAFAVAETKLMPGFSGYDARYLWRIKRGRDPFSMPVGHFPHVIEQGKKHITYSTMERLAIALLRLQRGVGPSPTSAQSQMAPNSAAGESSSQLHTSRESVEDAIGKAPEDTTASHGGVSPLRRQDDAAEGDVPADEEVVKVGETPEAWSPERRQRAMRKLQQTAPKLMLALRYFPLSEQPAGRIKAWELYELARKISRPSEEAVDTAPEEDKGEEAVPARQ